MDKVTQSNAAGAEESASAAEELNAQAESLKEAVASLQQLVGGSANSQAKRRVPRLPARAVGTQPAGRKSTPAAMPRDTAHHRDNGQAVSLDATTLCQREAIPLRGEFKDF
jgi:hypothetical protein